MNNISKETLENRQIFNDFIDEHVIYAPMIAQEWEDGKPPVSTLLFVKAPPQSWKEEQGTYKLNIFEELLIEEYE